MIGSRNSWPIFVSTFSLNEGFNQAMFFLLPLLIVLVVFASFRYFK